MEYLLFAVCLLNLEVSTEYGRGDLTVSNHGLNFRIFTNRVKARLHRRFLSPQLNAMFVALKLQLQNRTCAISPRYRRDTSRFEMKPHETLSSRFAIAQIYTLCLQKKTSSFVSTRFYSLFVWISLVCFY